MIDRRAFVAGAGIAAFAPVISLAPDLYRSPVPQPAAITSRPFLMIQGWSVLSERAPEDQLWIRVGHGWRTVWR